MAPRWARWAPGRLLQVHLRWISHAKPLNLAKVQLEKWGKTWGKTHSWPWVSLGPAWSMCIFTTPDFPNGWYCREANWRATCYSCTLLCSYTSLVHGSIGLKERLRSDPNTDMEDENEEFSVPELNLTAIKFNPGMESSFILASPGDSKRRCLSCWATEAACATSPRLIRHVLAMPSAIPFLQLDWGIPSSFILGFAGCSLITPAYSRSTKMHQEYVVFVFLSSFLDMRHVARGGEGRWVTAPGAAANFEATPTSQMETAAGWRFWVCLCLKMGIRDPQWSCW